MDRTAALDTTSSTARGPQGANIRFQFDGIPYSDVLERFAQMANKPLMADTNLQGTLTFNDSTAYSYQEALDTLNLMLSMKDMTLVESDHYLRLVPLKQLPQMPIKILRGLERRAIPGLARLSRSCWRSKTWTPKKLPKRSPRCCPMPGSVAPMSRGHGVIVTDRLANIQRIRSLLTMIDTQTTAERQMKAFTLLHASGAVVADLINRTFGSSTAPKAYPVQCADQAVGHAARLTRTTMSRQFMMTPRGRWSCLARVNGSRWPRS